MLHLERQVDYTVSRGKTNKVILFIVEGKSDKTSLALILSRIFSRSQIKFVVIGTDLTSDWNIGAAAILKTIDDKMEDFLRRHPYIEKGDIAKVVQIVDTDGAGVSEADIKESDTGETYYTDNEIYAKNVEKMKKRNQRKSTAMVKLYGTHKVSEIPYKVFYLSCNLEHVFHNIQNAPDSIKEDLSDDFSERFEGREIEFIDFINSPEFKVEGNYRDTWKYILKGRNSLHRNSNLHLLFDEDLEEIRCSKE